MTATRAQLLENFDEDVHRRLRMSLDAATVHLDRLGRALWELTRHELRDAAVFDEEAKAFELHAPIQGSPAGRYQLLASRSTDGGYPYRLGHPLAQWLVAAAVGRRLEPAEVVFDYSGHPVRVSLVEALRGQAGHLRLTRITVNALEQEDHLVFAGVSDSGAPLDAETCEKLFGVAARVATNGETPSTAEAALEARLAAEREALLDRIGARNTRFFEEEIEKLERWADDLKNGLEREVKDLDAEIRTAKRDAKLEASLDAKVAAQRKVRELEAERNRKRRALFEAQDEVDRQKEALITRVEARLRQTVEAEPRFTIRWRVI